MLERHLRIRDRPPAGARSLVGHLFEPPILEVAIVLESREARISAREALDLEHPAAHAVVGKLGRRERIARRGHPPQLVEGDQC